MEKLEIEKQQNHRMEKVNRFLFRVPVTDRRCEQWTDPGLFRTITQRNGLGKKRQKENK